MRIHHLLTTSLRGVLAHKMRSILTMLGIVFGIGAVICMLAIGEGARREISDIISTMGVNNIYIQDNPKVRESEKEKVVSRGLQLDDLTALQRICPDIKTIVPVREENLLLAAKYRKLEQKLIFTTSDYFPVLNIGLAKGRSFSPIDIQRSHKVCIIGKNIADRLFPLSNALGQVIDMQTDFYGIIGQIGHKHMATSNKINIEISDYNRLIFLPITTYYDRFAPGKDPVPPLTSAIIQAYNKDHLPVLRMLVRNVLLKRHYDMEDFELILPEELLRQHQKTQNLFNLVMLAIASISLLVGGIGIMNIMLSSVMERIKEIGVRRAMGATQRDIIKQFLLEAVLLTFAGGIMGVVAGIVGAKVVSVMAGYTTVTTVGSILLSFLVSTGVGLIFGYYPARKASLMHPIEALRYE